MRQRTDSRSGKSPETVLEKNFREIVVGNGRSQEPYIIAFHYASDNVSGSPLGTLFGFFEVEIHDQDAAYIVNFLASVAKKEYFANPRRNPIESFEASLHKINIALAEIVKHGNISWLGHLHGAIGAVSENYLNFSVTGEGELYLAREEALRSISEGLADTGSEPHPLKTFTEVSSGDLHDGDLIFALSPSIWSLFSPEDLRRSLNRLGPAGFEQFLRTALVNELPVAAVALLTCAAPVELQSEARAKESHRKPAISLGNVWSDTPFVEALEMKSTAPVAKSEPATTISKVEEYTDKKTGHIYVQASVDEAFDETGSPWKERWELYSHGFGIKLHSLHVSAKKVGRRVGKEGVLAMDSLTGQLAIGRRSLGRRIRTLKRIAQSRWETYHRQRHPTPPLSPTPAPPLSIAVPEPKTTISPVTPEAIPTPEPTAMRKRFGEVSVKIQPTLVGTAQTARRLLTWLQEKIASGLSQLNGFWQTLSPKQKWSVIGILSMVLFFGFIAIIRNTRTTAPIETALPTTPLIITPSSVFPPKDEPLAQLLGENHALFKAEDSSSLALVSINETSFWITQNTIVNLATQESASTPETIRLAAAMDDLDSLFLLGASGKLYLYSVTTKQFTENTLPVPAGTKIDALGAYLTYLYVLDRNAGILQRFPRADGGFGTATIWSKETLSLAPDGAIAVFENIALTLRNKEPALFSRGTKMNVVFAGTKTLVTTDALAFDQKTGDLLVLDRANKRVVRWSANGTLIAQYFHQSLNGAESLAVSPKGTELLVSDQQTVTAWSLR